MMEAVDAARQSIQMVISAPESFSALNIAMPVPTCPPYGVDADVYPPVGPLRLHYLRQHILRAHVGVVADLAVQEYGASRPVRVRHYVENVLHPDSFSAKLSGNFDL